MMRVKKAGFALSWLPRIAFAVGIVFMGVVSLHAQQPGLGDDTDKVIDYYSNVGLADPVSQLQHDIDSGKVKLEYEPKHGYLISVLQHLNIPVNTQTLVFSKTSSQGENTSPDKPRALYFNDGAYVGWAQNDPLLDLIAMDPKKGPIFFTLSQDPKAKIIFNRDASCMNCHFSPKTLNVPGLVIRSVFTKPDGHAISQLNTFVAGHTNPLSERWGGWYVTGTHGQDTHMGNTFLAGQDPKHLQLAATSNITDLSNLFDTKKYLVPSSDTVALLILDDAVRMENMIVRAKYQTLHALNQPPLKNEPANYRERIIAQAGDPLVLYMLFRDEAPMKGPVKGVTDFETEFQKEGPRDSKGRSLRDLDLKTRLFKYPCNYRIYSPGFDAMPVEMKTYIWMRLDQVLTGQDKTPYFKDMAESDRNNVREILLDTKPEFKAWMQANDPAHA
jgi:hypothetical protein